MTSFEIKSTLGIAFIYMLRMLGLFIVLPIMSIYLSDLGAGASTFLIGLTFGIYGLTQAYSKFHLEYYLTALEERK